MKRQRTVMAGLGAIACSGQLVAGLAVAAAPALGVERGSAGSFTPVTRLVSVTPAGTSGNNFSLNPSMARFGRYVAFQSAAGDLVRGDTNGFSDIYVRDLVVGSTQRVSVDQHGGDPNQASFLPKISADGRFVVFLSSASDLVAGDTNGRVDAFLRDRFTHRTVRITAGQFDHDPTRAINSVSVSGNGSRVAYDLAVGVGASPAVFVREMKTGATRRISVKPDGSPGSGGSPTLSANGRYVAFLSGDDDLVAGDGNGFGDVFRRDLLTTTTAIVSVPNAAGTANGDAVGGNPGISADGRFVTFFDDASNLVTGDGNNEPDIFRRDVRAGTTVRANVTSQGTEVSGFGNFHTVRTDVSDNGRWVSFSTDQSFLTPNDGNGQPDVFVRDVPRGKTTLVSVARTARSGDGFSTTPTMTGDGALVAFDSDADNLTVNDSPEHIPDVFVRAVRA